MRENSRGHTLIEAITAMVLASLVLIQAVQLMFLSTEKLTVSGNQASAAAMAENRKPQGTISILSAHGSISLLITDICSILERKENVAQGLEIRERFIRFPGRSTTSVECPDPSSVNAQTDGIVIWVFTPEKGLTRKITPFESHQNSHDSKMDDSSSYRRFQGVLDFRISAYDQKGTQIHGRLEQMPERIVISYRTSAETGTRTWSRDSEVF
ncbi:MAG: hypothetical protein CVV64_09375 [Candidatus Wallbacteria bacterium HGW-Wallbacteria-1]|jgi:type II secretory pathway component PulJ|uniref:Uncharacterized protein n=1 Tax=Candidatus Wallbacteria bacterium HGW-Wallbacteria-1 TaxID=2013854 RepID=A0A2N1PQE3_9BACT|nr:MAG: hypothetical protein CVV64_09375 [Candidatus Wallbacteria bacterium HGW-Wallbacteria-1]